MEKIITDAVYKTALNRIEELLLNIPVYSVQRIPEQYVQRIPEHSVQLF